jgi:hypothetical protein
MSDIIGPLNDLWADDELLTGEPRTNRSYAGEPSAAWRSPAVPTRGWSWNHTWVTDSMGHALGHAEKHPRLPLWGAVTVWGQHLGCWASEHDATWAVTSNANAWERERRWLPPIALPPARWPNENAPVTPDGQPLAIEEEAHA